MKKIICILMIAVLSVGLISCGGNSTPPSEDNAEAILSPTETVDCFLKALKAKDFDSLKEYYEGDIGDLSLLEEEDDDALKDVINVLVDKILDFDYTLDNEKIDGDFATVDVEFKTYNFGGIMQDILDNMLSDAVALGLSGLTQEELESEINELIGTKFKDAVTEASKDYSITITMDLVKKDGKWLVKDISNADDFMNALSGGLMDMAESLANATE